ncbi:MAG: tetratricopeptide repeat protein [Phycisphaerae bacterium]
MDKKTTDSTGIGRHPLLGWMLVFAVALALRVHYLHQIEGLVYFYHLVGDAAGYDEWGQRLAGGEWWWPETFYQAPLYPYFLAGTYKLLGHDTWALRLVQCVLGAAGCVMVALAGDRFFSRRAGLAAGLLMALYPPAIYFDGIVQKASLGFVLTAGLLWALGTGAKRPSKWLWLTVGVLLGLLALTRENALALGPVVVAWLVFWLPSRSLRGPLPYGRGSDGTRGCPRTDRWAAVAMVVAGLGLTLLPVGFHNQRVGGEFSLTTFQMGPNFYMGNHAEADGRYKPMVAGRETPQFERADATMFAERAMGRTLTPREVSHYWLAQSWKYIRSDPFGWLRLLGLKWCLTWNRYEIPDTEGYFIYREFSPLLSLLGRVLHFGVLCPLAVLGVALTWSRRRELALLYVLALVTAGAVALFYVFGRYRLPLVPILGIFAGAGVVETLGCVTTRRWPALAGALAIALAAAVWVNWPINPETKMNASQWGNLGVVLAQRDRLNQALPCFEQAVAMYPQAPRLQQFLADALSLAGRYAEAIPHYRKATQLEPRRAHAHFNLAVALERVGRIDEAIEDYHKAVDIDPTDQEALKAIERLTGANRSN